MAAALSVVAGLLLLIWCGTWLLQIALWLIQLAILLVRRSLTVVAGLAGVVVLLLTDRDGLRRALANDAAHQRVRTTLARERWS
ncbi:hypothetical protein [Brevundimonas sp. GCM10030266]|uniref:hypothetical protein n=1 Tax=Brevundimonas sp. GCM10030266 TaxID=3273386 RepID=UPI003616F5E6